MPSCGMLFALVGSSLSTPSATLGVPVASNDLAVLQGSWVLVSEMEDGKQVTRHDFYTTVKGDLLVFYAGHTIVGTWQIVLDPMKTPMALQMKYLGVPLVGLVGENWKVDASIAIEGDSLRISYFSNGAPRPHDLNAGHKFQNFRVWKRTTPIKVFDEAGGTRGQKKNPPGEICR